MHHAPCTPGMGKQYAYQSTLGPRTFHKVSDLQLSTAQIEQELVRDYADHVHPRRYFFDKLPISSPYAYASNFHRAMDNVSRLECHDGQWVRHILPDPSHF